MNESPQSIIRQAGAIALTHYRQGVTAAEKSNRGDVVTKADMEVSVFLVEAIHRRYPDHHIASEELEHDLNPGVAIQWMIDPIDGIRNFANAIPVWCTLIGVLEDDKPYLGAIYDARCTTPFFCRTRSGRLSKWTVHHRQSNGDAGTCLRLVFTCG